MRVLGGRERRPQPTPPTPLLRRFRITGGSKFGSDFLAYPGDPTLYHAQFCVRTLAHDVPLLPAMLASATRGSFQARKHLLVATVIEAGGEGGGKAPQHQQQQQGEEERQEAAAGGGEQPGGAEQQHQQGYRVQYMTLGPVDGFG